MRKLLRRLSAFLALLTKSLPSRPEIRLVDRDRMVAGARLSDEILREDLQGSAAGVVRGHGCDANEVVGVETRLEELPPRSEVGTGLELLHLPEHVHHFGYSLAVRSRPKRDAQVAPLSRGHLGESLLEPVSPVFFADVGRPSHDTRHLVVGCHITVTRTLHDTYQNGG